MDQYANEFGDHIDSIMECGMEANQKRYSSYRYIVRCWKGVLSKGTRIKLPVCVIREVRDTFPERSGEYTGHKDYPESGKDITI